MDCGRYRAITKDTDRLWKIQSNYKRYEWIVKDTEQLQKIQVDFERLLKKKKE